MKRLVVLLVLNIQLLALLLTIALLAEKGHERIAILVMVAASALAAYRYEGFMSMTYGIKAIRFAEPPTVLHKCILFLSVLAFLGGLALIWDDAPGFGVVSSVAGFGLLFLLTKKINPLDMEHQVEIREAGQKEIRALSEAGLARTVLKYGLIPGIVLGLFGIVIDRLGRGAWPGPSDWLPIMIGLPISMCLVVAIGWWGTVANGKRARENQKS